MSDQEPDVVIEAEFIQDDKTLKGAPKVVEAAHHAASMLDGIAGAVSKLSPNTADEMREHAGKVRAVASGVEVAIDHGKKLGGSVKELLAKVGIEPHLEKRARGLRGARAR